MEGKWCVLRDALTKAGQEHLGYARRSQADWFIANRSNLAPLIQERRLRYNRWVASQSPSDYSQFKSARSKARAAVRRAKNKWLVEVAEQAESSKHGGAVWSTIRAIQ